MLNSLTRKQKELFDFLLQNQDKFNHPPTLEELCMAIGLKSRGSLHTHIKALIEASLIEAPERKQRGIRLTEYAKQSGQSCRCSKCIAICWLYRCGETH